MPAVCPHSFDHHMLSLFASLGVFLLTPFADPAAAPSAAALKTDAEAASADGTPKVDVAIADCGVL